MNWTLLGGSLAAVLALAGIAAWLKLGGDPLTENDALGAAGDMLSDFIPEAALLGSDGAAALVRGREGRIALVKRHGAQAAIRELAWPADLSPDASGTKICSGERMFGDVSLRGRSAVEIEGFALGR